MNLVFRCDRNCSGDAGFARAWIDIESREATAVNYYAEPVPGPKKITGRPQVDTERIDLTRDEKGWHVVGFTIACALDSVTNQHGAAIRIDIT